MVLRCRPLLEWADHFFTAGELTLRDDEAEWGAVAKEIGVAPDRLLRVRQVHGAVVALARRNGGAAWAAPEADVLAGDDPSSALVVRVADCAPVLVADRTCRVVAAAHAGWRGTVRRAAAAAVEALERHFGARPQDLVAAVGPCLGPCCGEVGEEVPQAFGEAGHDRASLERWFAPGPAGRPHLDLWQANVDQLAAAGVPRGQIHVARLCTRTHAEILHSHRARGAQAGRMAGVIRPRT